MNIKVAVEYADFASLILCAFCLTVMWRTNAIKHFKCLMAFVALEAVSDCIGIPILFFRKALGIPKPIATNVFFYSGWVIFILQSALLIGIVYSVFHLAMKPLKGLHEMGKLAFRWVAGVALVLSVALGLGPHLSSPGYSLASAWISASSHIMQGISILILCLLLFVCFSIRPLGLTFRSRIFGVSVGLGVYAAMQLVASAWTSLSQTSSVYSPTSLLNAIGAVVGYGIWLTYFALPEPERKMILLPTTSPYFFWNAISEALGDDPGHVVVAGFTPKSLAPAELHLITQNDQLEAARMATSDYGYEAAGVAPRRRNADRELVAAN